jgi:hypothetical protein
MKTCFKKMKKSDFLVWKFMDAPFLADAIMKTYGPFSADKDRQGGGFSMNTVKPYIRSGICPALAVTNEDAECGIGAVVPWAGKLWYITYPPHRFLGSGDRLYSLDENFSSVPFSESVGGTHANRMIHRESNQLIIGLYFIDAAGNVRSISPTEMPGRMTAVARHLTDPANKVYFYTMEQGLYEVDVHTLQVKTLHGDLNITKSRPLLPGNHGKGAYTGQGRLVVTHNGNGGVLAEWDGTGNPADPNSWTIVDRNKYTEITGPGGIFGADDGQSPLWALGWDQRSVLLNVRQNGEWTRFRLPKGSYTHEADHGWYTEWPRIRDTGRDHLLMDVQGMYYAFPRSFAANRTAGIRPISQHLQMSVDFSRNPLRRKVKRFLGQPACFARGETLLCLWSLPQIFWMRTDSLKKQPFIFWGWMSNSGRD